MMLFKRRRLLFWLLKAYVKKKGKSILFFFFLGFILFAALFFFGPLLLSKISLNNKQVIGLVGSYSPDRLPPEIVNKLSEGLTKIDKNGRVIPGIAKSWDITENGKVYVFHLSTTKLFSDGSPVTSNDISYNFSDVKVDTPNKNTIIYHLRDIYSPFPVTVSRPIFKNNSVGVSNYKISNVKVNAGFVQSLTISNVQDPLKSITYRFYPTEEALKNAYALGEITEADGLIDLKINQTDFSTFTNTKIINHLDSGKLVTAFFNTQDVLLSDSKLRDALAYSLPDSFSFGQRSYTPYPPNEWYSSTDTGIEKHFDLTHSQLLIKATGITVKNPLIIKTTDQYQPIAKELQKAWKQIGIPSTIQVVDTVPQVFQIYLTSFNLPQDPDQYVLWHSGQPNNISNYKNLRIDKLLEDGRKTEDIATRKQLYQDFAKYLNDDTPAVFLYFPYEYDISRK